MARTRSSWPRVGMVGLVALALATATVAAFAIGDFGSDRDADLASRSLELFGVDAAIAASSTNAITKTAAVADPRSLVTLAPGLSARVVSANAIPPWIDQLALWPDDVAPTHIIACNELNTSTAALVRIEIATGAWQKMLTGVDKCDGMRRTPWGTIIFAEERSVDGRAFELIDPLAVSNVVVDRATGVFSGGVGAANFTTRPDLGKISWEGLAVLPTGVVYYADERRPQGGKSGGAIYKFVPATPWGGGTVTSLAESPLADGTIYGLRIGAFSNNSDYGSGSNFGRANWIRLCDAVDLPACADFVLRQSKVVLTGGYRPEDIDINTDALAAGNVRICGARTGEVQYTQNPGEVVCLADGTLTAATENTAQPVLTQFVVGTTQLEMPDNVAYQPGRGNWIVHEDAVTNFLGRNDDVWSCLPDGIDDDLLSDGCIRIMTLNDRPMVGPGLNPNGSEPTGGIFTADGTKFYMSLMHNVTGKGLILEITGWQ